MNNTINEIIENNIKNQLEGKYIAPLILAGEPGMGKTQRLKYIAEKNNMQIVELSLPSCLLETLSGLPTDMDASNMNEYNIINSNTTTKATIWSVPEIVYIVNSIAQKGNQVILALEDLHETPKPLQPYLYNLLLERKIGQFKLDKRVIVLGSMNDSEEANFQGMSSAIRNRLAILQLKLDKNYFLTNIGNKFHYFISSFLKSYPKFINEQEETGIEGFGSPRAWEFLSTSFKSLDKDFIIKNIKLLASQYVSEECTLAFSSHVEFINKIDFNNILNEKKIFDVSKESIDKQAVLFYIINDIKTIEDSKYIVDLINKNIENKNFLGYLFEELRIRYEEAKSRGKVAMPIQILIDKLLNFEYDENNYEKKFTNKEMNIYNDIEFNNKDIISKIAVQYLLS